MSMERRRLRVVAPTPRRRRDRSLGLTIFIGLVLLSVLGLVFSVAQGSQRITGAAGALHTTDETLRTATVARAQVALAVHMAVVDRELGTNSSEAIGLSMDEALLALSDFNTGIEHLGADADTSDDALDTAAEGLALRRHDDQLYHFAHLWCAVRCACSSITSLICRSLCACGVGQTRVAAFSRALSMVPTM